MTCTSPVLPLELLLEIASFIHQRIDLLALASTCHVLYNALVPHWLDFIDVSCPISFTPLWVHLSERPTLCQRIQTLKLTDSMTLETTCVPSLQSSLREFLTAASSVDQPQLIYNVLPNLRNLRCLRGFFKSSSVTSVIQVAECLKRSGCALKELELFMMTSFDEGLKRARFSVWFLPDLLSKSDDLLTKRSDPVFQSKSFFLVQTLYHSKRLRSRRSNRPYSDTSRPTKFGTVEAVPSQS